MTASASIPISGEIEAIVRVVGAVKSYDGRPVVNGVDLAIRPGECFGILGPNGAGKTTLMRILQGVTPLDAGEAQLFGRSVAVHGRDIRKTLGIVPQFDNLDPDFSVRENLLMYGRYFGLSKEVLAARVGDLLAFASLEDRAEARISQLSGGMKRRLTIARALINDPALVILDEPTTGLDPQARHRIWQRLRGLMERGKTLLLTTHYMDEAARLCQRVAIMDHGRILETEAPDALVHKHLPRHVVEWQPRGLAVTDLPKGICTRVEEVGEEAFLYTDQVEEMVHFLQTNGETFRQRPTGLEDVFLKLTGRDLRG